MESKHCQNVNYQVSTGLCWRQGTEVGENRGNRVDNQLQTNNITKHSVKMVLLSEQMTTNAQCTYTDLKPIMIKSSSPRAKRAGPMGLRAESARAVTGRRNSHRWEGGRLFEPSAGFFYGNSCNFGTKSRKIVSKVGN